MTDLQDAILDRLVGSRIGVNWPDGPLTVAAEVVGGSKPLRFGMTDNDRGAKSEIARRLGYPVLLIEAIQGANRAFPAVDDRRSFAMTVFQTIPVGGKIPRLGTLEQNRIAGRMAVHVHPFLCTDTGCPAVKMLARLLDADQVTRNMAHTAYRTRCTAAEQALTLRTWLSANSSPIERLMQTVRHVVNGLRRRSSIGGWCSIRESVRLAASERGMAEAVTCCTEIARQCGLMGKE